LNDSVGHVGWKSASMAVSTASGELTWTVLVTSKSLRRTLLIPVLSARLSLPSPCSNTDPRQSRARLEGSTSDTPHTFEVWAIPVSVHGAGAAQVHDRARCCACSDLCQRWYKTGLSVDPQAAVFASDSTIQRAPAEGESDEQHNDGGAENPFPYGSAGLIGRPEEYGSILHGRGSGGLWL
jgi:hypothetical protein